MAGVLLVALVMVFVVMRPKDKPVATVVGQQVQEAQTILKDDGFEVEVKRTTNVVAEDKVLGQMPSGGVEATDGSTVILTVSAGAGQGTVPDVAELAEPRAQAALREAGFKPRAAREFSAAIAAGRAIRSKPAAGARLKRGGAVTFAVSRGAQTAGVPDLLGRAESAARTAVQQAGLRIEIVSQRSNQSPGDVLSQAPRGGSTAVLGSIVEVVVDKAPKPVEVPNVQGEPVEDAVSTLSKRGLAVFFRTKESKDSGEQDKVLGQQPGAGAKAQPGSRVVLQVAKLEPG